MLEVGGSSNRDKERPLDFNIKVVHIRDSTQLKQEPTQVAQGEGGLWYI